MVKRYSTRKMDSKGRLLILAYAYPPTENVGGQRPSKWAKYLPEYGWSVDIVTSGGERSEEVPDSVYATGELLSQRFDAPHGGLRWFPGMVKQAWRLSRQHDYDYILATGPPFIPFSGVPIISRLTETPYILDFRDPWAPKLRRVDSPAKGILSRIYTMCSNTLEGKVVRSAMLNITPVPELTDRYRLEYSSAAFTTIYNGFDPTDYDIEPEPQSNLTRLVYPGRYYQDMDLIFEYLKSDPSSELVYFGNDETIETKATEYGVESSIDHRGYQPIERVASCIKSADCGVAVTREGAAIAQKCYDYMGCKTPVLAIDAFSGAQSRVVTEADVGISVTNLTVENVSKAIHEISIRDDFQFNTDQFNRKKQAEELSDIMSCGRPPDVT